MSDVKLFRITDGSAEELVGRPVKLEKKLHVLIERYIETFLHVRFVASEYYTGKTHAGRIDTLGLDENFCPTIIEYKRNSNANVINQGLNFLRPLQQHLCSVCRQFCGGAETPEGAGGEHLRRVGGLHVGVGVTEVDEPPGRYVELGGDLNRRGRVGFDRDFRPGTANDFEMKVG